MPSSTAPFIRTTMAPVPLLISQILAFGSTAHAASEVVTWQGANIPPRRSSYADIGRDCARLAHALQSLGVGDNTRVGTFMWNNEEHLELYFAVPGLGAVLHPLNIRLFNDQLIAMVDQAHDEVMFVDACLAEKIAGLLPSMPTVRIVIVNGSVPPSIKTQLARGSRSVYDYQTLLAEQSDVFDWPEIDENSAAAMSFTTGTTGDPKGIVYSHRSTYLHAMQTNMSSAMAMTQDDRMLLIVPMFHANGWGLPYGALMSGASLILPDRFMQAEQFALMIAAERVTDSAAIPTLWSGLLEYLDLHPDVDVSSLTTAIVGGSVCPPQLIRAFDIRYSVNIIHAWGMTEMSPTGTLAIPPRAATDSDRWKYRTSQGRFSPLVQARLMADNELVTHNGHDIGEVQVRGPWITHSYLADDQDRFQDGWLRTGDVGSITPDGFLRLADRVSDLIRSGGEWISSVALENLLMDHPGVIEAAVVAVPDEHWGERPLACVVSDAELDLASLREFLTTKVASWQIPAHWLRVADIPKTSIGKVDKKLLRARFAVSSTN
jgi:fatty-acyl-CoA synthase